MNRAKIFITLTFLLAFALQISAQNNLYLNELKGYEFFEKGKLKELQLTISSKNDVRKIFGENCEKNCDYNADWSIHFEYFEDIWMMGSYNEKEGKLTYYLDSKYLGKLRLIEIRPKKQISFSGVVFPNSFQKFIISSTSVFDSNKNRLRGDEAFQDSSGLTYEILTETISYDIKNEKTKSYNKGDLVLIRYSLTKELKKSLFVLQK